MGLKPTKEKLDAILNAPEPKDLTQLRSYLGMLNFYRKFLVSAAAILEPLNALLRKDVHWEWKAKWLNVVMKAMKKGSLRKEDWVSWSAFLQKAVIPPAAINALLPLFLDNAHSVAMIKHSMDIVRTSVQLLNPGQIPVLTADQPLFAFSKQIQWIWPAMHGEDYFVIMFGGLHIEMAILKVSNFQYQIPFLQ